MLSDKDLENWILTVTNVQVVMSVVVAITLMGWVVWRLMIWSGWIKVKKKKSVEQKSQAKDPKGNQPKKGQPSISRKALYSSRRHSN